MSAKQAELQQLRTASHSSTSHCINQCNQCNSSIRSMIMITVNSQTIVNRVTVVRQCGICTLNSSLTAERKPAINLKCIFENNIARRIFQKSSSLPSYLCIFENLKFVDQTHMEDTFFIWYNYINSSPTNRQSMYAREIIHKKSS